MSSSAWLGWNKDGTILKLHDKNLIVNYNCQKQTTFSLKQYQLEAARFRNNIQKPFIGNQTAWKKFLQPALKKTTPFIEMAVEAKTKNQQVAQAKKKFFKINHG